MKRRYLTLGISLFLVSVVTSFTNPNSWVLRPGTPEPLYLTTPVERGDIKATLSATGTLAAVGTVKVSSQLSGQVAELLVDFNEQVTKGQPLAKLDPSAFAARVRQAEAALETATARVAISRAALEQAMASVAGARTSRMAGAAYVQSAQAKAASAKRELERKRILVDRAALAQAAGDDALMASQAASALLAAAEAEQESRDATIQAAEADLRIAAAQLQFAKGVVKQQIAVLEQSQVDLANTVIRAPIDGEIIGRDVDRGQIVAASLSAPTLFTIAQDLHQMEVHAKIDEADIGRIRVGQIANFTVDSNPRRIFGARVAQIRKAPSMIQNVVTYTAVLTASNLDLALLPGMTAVVQIIVEQAEDVLKIPNAALRFRLPANVSGSGPISAQAAGAASDGLSTIWILGERGTPAPVQVRLGRSNANATEIVAGPVSPGQRVVVGIASGPQGWFFGIR